MTGEEMEDMPNTPFIGRKYVFDEDLAGILDEVSKARCSLPIRLITSKNDQRRQILGKWYDNYLAINTHWSRLARNYDNKYQELVDNDTKKAVETAYLEFERVNIEGILDTLRVCVNARVLSFDEAGKHPLCNRIAQMADVWCNRGKKPMRTAVLNIL